MLITAGYIARLYAASIYPRSLYAAGCSSSRAETATRTSCFGQAIAFKNMIDGKLVRLRPIELNDLERYIDWVNDPEVVRYQGARYPWSRVAEEDWLKEAMRKTSPPEIILAIDTLAEGLHIGSVGLHEIHRENRKAVLGIMIGDKTFWDRGYGTDTVRTLLRFAFRETNLHRVQLIVHQDNARAIACYRKCGFVEEGRLREDWYQDGRYADTIVMGVLAPEFHALSDAQMG
jgi:RimJ/RimL family protein N-acetyltransferase